MATYSRHLSRSKSKYGITSILFTSTISHTWNISGYFSGLSWPSGTDKIMAFFTAPVSNSAGQTRLPTFSRIAKSMSPVPRPSNPCRVISASRWHIPPVCSWIDFAPVPAMARASTSESMSASITPMRSSSLRAAMVLRSVVVLPDPGALIRLSRNTFFAFRSARSAAACSSLEAKMLCFTSRIFMLSMGCSL